jgi:hypothetical protein
LTTTSRALLDNTIPMVQPAHRGATVPTTLQRDRAADFGISPQGFVAIPDAFIASSAEHDE